MDPEAALTPRRPPETEERPPSSALNALPTGTRTELWRALVRRRVKAGAALFQEGEPGEAAYVVMKGLFKALKFSQGERVSAMDLIVPGRLCGVIALLDHRPYPVSVYALQDAEVLVLPAAVFHRLMSQHPEFSRAVHGEVGDHLRHAQDMRARASEPVDKRLAHLLLMLLPAPGAEVRVRREDLAELVGCIPETAIRTLSEFKKRGWIRTGWKRIALLNPDALRRLSRSPANLP